MPLNATQSQQVKRAAEELAIKLRLEAKFGSELARLFRRIGADLSTTLATSGGAVSANVYENDLRRILDRNYKRVQKRFVNELVWFLENNRSNISEPIISELTSIANAKGVSIGKMIKNMKASIKNDLDAFRVFNVNQSTGVITVTTQKEIDKAISSASAALREELGDDPTNGQLARKTQSLFFGRQIARSRMIAATETQNAAEGTKQVERDNFSSIRNGPVATQLDLPPRDPKEIWVTQADNFVRDGDGKTFNHLAADGQEKINGTFTVSNQLLRYPGDRSLGASAGNVIRCRCSAVTVIN